MTRLRAALAPLAALAAVLQAPPAIAAGPASYLYRLSDFSGTVPYSDVILRADRKHDEIYAAAGNSIRVFNGAGMEEYEFDEDPVAGQVVDLAMEESGDILILSHPQAPTPGEPSWFIRHCDYRGVPYARILLEGAPAELGDFRPDMIFYRDGGLLLADRQNLKAVEADLSGKFRRAIDLAKMIGLGDRDRGRNDIGGLSLDARGRILLTIPTLPKAFILSPEGDVKSFGRAGSVAGAFGIPAGIVADDGGNIIVADKGRSVVMIFNPALEFVTEFGAEGGPAGLIRPTDLALGNDDKLYVTQSRDRGVSVFRVGPGPSQPDTPG